jgi:hypothetical protein
MKCPLGRLRKRLEDNMKACAGKKNMSNREPGYRQPFLP